MVDEISPKALALRLRQALNLSGKSQTELAALFEISDAAVSKWLRSGKISRDRLPVVARFLGVRLEWLAEGCGDVQGDDPDAEDRVFLAAYRTLPPEEKAAVRTLVFRGRQPQGQGQGQGQGQEGRR